MKELVVISGKGGTGKTSLTAALAVLSSPCVVTDCDVDAPDLHLVLQPQTIQQQPFVGGRKACIITSTCRKCGKCVELCRFGAIRHKKGDTECEEGGFLIDALACEGCGVCVDHCPERAIELRPYVNGQWYLSRFHGGYLFHATLDVGSENSGKLVTQLRRAAHEFATKRGVPLILTDGPPGIGCPVIASLTGASLALIVTEPTVAGLHDFERIARLCRQLGVPAVTVINKADINPETSDRIANSSIRYGTDVIGMIPFDSDIVRAQMAARSVVEVSDGPAARAMRAIHSTVMSRLEKALDVHSGEFITIDVTQIDNVKSKGVTT